MAYKHGIYIYEVPTKVIPPVLAEVGLPVVFGTAPIHTATHPAETNTPKLIYSYEEAVKYFGYSDDWDKYTLSEFIYSQFVLYQRAPVVLVNLLDPSKHVKEGTEEVTLAKGKGTFENKDIIAESVEVKNTTGDNTYAREGDYVLSYDNEGTLFITAVKGKIPDGKVKVTFTQLDPTKVTKKEIIGGINVTDHKKQGLELISEIYPRFRLVPGLILAPGFSHDPEVAAIMNSKARNINGMFKANALIDAPADKDYTEIPEWKNLNNIMDTGQFCLYPKLKLGERVYHFSTQFAGVINRTDTERMNIPYASPSNKLLQSNAPVLDDGTEVFLGNDQANYLNGNGIVTALNWIGGWKTWGNRTAIYPGVSDVKDSFIPIRRMFDWVGNSLILTYWQKVDEPTNKRLIETVIDSANIWLNSLTAIGALLGGRVEFLKTENPVTDVMDGIIKFHVYLTPPSPAREIDFIMEYDVDYVRAFIEEMAGDGE